MELFGGDELIMLSPNSPAQMMGFILKGDGVAVIDGGTAADGPALEQMLVDMGGEVDGWLLTHAHYDHIMALAYVLHDGRVKVNKIYRNFPFLPFLKEREEEEAGAVPCVEDYLKIEEMSAVPVLRAEKGAVIEAGGFKFTVLTDGGKATGSINDTSVVYRAETKGSPVLFLGDLERGGEENLKRDFSELLPTPVVQMAHHGQNGVSLDFYDLVRPEVCLFPTPRWLYDNLGGHGPYKTKETLKKVEALGAKAVFAFDAPVFVR